MKRSVTEMVFMLLLLTLFVGCSFVTIERCASFYQRMLRDVYKRQTSCIPNDNNSRSQCPS